MYLDDLITELGSLPPKRIEKELRLHKQVAEYLRWSVPLECVWLHIPNGGKRSKKVSGEFAAMGLKAGAPDLMFVWRGRALFIELKAEGGTLSLVQRQMHAKLRLAGSIVEVCYSLDEVVAVLRGWEIPLMARPT